MGYAPKKDVPHHDYRGYALGCGCKECTVDHNVVDDLIVHAIFEGVVRIDEVPGGLNVRERLLLGELCVLDPCPPEEERSDGRVHVLTPGAQYDRLMNLPRSSGQLPKGARRLMKATARGRQRTKGTKIPCAKCGKLIPPYGFKDGAPQIHCRDCKTLEPAGFGKRSE